MTTAPDSSLQDPVHALKDQKVLVLGLGLNGQAACQLLLKQGANVTVLEEGYQPFHIKAAKALKSQGVDVRLRAKGLPRSAFDLAVIGSDIAPNHTWLNSLQHRATQVISELELGFQQSYCLNISVTGTNGKTTTTGLIERILAQHQVKALLAGRAGSPVCAVTEQTRDVDFIVLEVNSFQLEHIRFFRPAVAVILNITTDHMDRYGHMGDYVRTKAKILQNQQAFDWAIVQSEVLAQFNTMNLPVPSKMITFSAHNRRADLYMDRGLLISRMEGWTGPLLDMDRCRLRGPHNAENLMAALAVGRVLRIPLDSMIESLQTFTPPEHRCEMVAEINGVSYVNDAKSTNVDSLRKALLSLPQGEAGQPNVWVIAGGRDKGAQFHDVGPLLSQRVKGAFLIGEAQNQLRAAWSLFTPCSLMQSLLEAVKEAARNARAGDIILLSPACSSFDQFENYRHRGEVFREAVKELARMASNASHSDRSGQKSSGPAS